MESSEDEDDEYEFEDAQNLFDVIAEMFMQRWVPCFVAVC